MAIAAALSLFLINRASYINLMQNLEHVTMTWLGDYLRDGGVESNNSKKAWMYERYKIIGILDTDWSDSFTPQE